MFDLIRSNARLRYAMLVVVVVPLSFVGGNFFVGGDVVISVGSSEITREEYDFRYRRVLENLREQGVDVDGLADSDLDAVTGNLVSELVSQLMEREAIERKSLVATDDDVRRFIAQMENFQGEDGAFSAEIFSELVSDEREFVAQVRAQVNQNRFDDWFRTGAVVSDHALSWYASHLSQVRDVSVAVYSLEQFRGQATFTEADALGYYGENLSDFVVRERGRAQYFTLSLDDFAAREEANDEEIAQAYAELQDIASEAEVRRISHILLDDASAAREVADLAQADPDRFAQLAAERSLDAGSASIGGDLGFVVRGSFDEALEEAAYALEPGEVSGPVESAFGVHVLKLTEVRTEEPLGGIEEMRDELAERVRRDKASLAFDELVLEINERLYLEVDRLAPVAAEYGLELRETRWLDPENLPGAGGEDGEAEEGNPPPFDDLALLETLFSPAHRQGESTELLPAGEGVYVAARMVEHTPARQKSYEEVADEVRDKMADAEAARIAFEQISADIRKLREGETVAIAWQPEEKVSLAGDSQSETLTEIDYDAVQRIDMSRGLPAYAISPGDDEVRLLRVSAVEDVPPDEETLERAQGEYLGNRSGLERLGYLESLSRSVPVVIRVDR